MCATSLPKINKVIFTLKIVTVLWQQTFSSLCPCYMEHFDMNKICCFNSWSVFGCLTHSYFNAYKANLNNLCAVNIGAFCMSAVTHCWCFISSKPSSYHQVPRNVLSHDNQYCLPLSLTQVFVSVSVSDIKDCNIFNVLLKLISWLIESSASKFAVASKCFLSTRTNSLIRCSFNKPCLLTQ